MLSTFDYHKPSSLQEALDFLGNNPGTKLLAGGTDLMVVLRRNMEIVDHILDIKKIPETNRFEYVTGEGLFIGASVTVNQISESKEVADKYPSLKESADSLASYQLRNRATLVGNICNASPGADMSSPLLVYDAVVHIASKDGIKEVPVQSFFTGVKKTVLNPGEIVIGVHLPEVKAGDTSVFLKQARIKGHDLGIAGITLRLTSDKQVKIAMSAVAPTPIRLLKLEALIEDRGLSDLPEWIENEIKQHIKPISDIRSSADYRLHVSGVLAKKGMIKLMEKGGN